MARTQAARASNRRLGFHRAVIDEAVQKSVERDDLDVVRRRIALGARELEELVDQNRKAANIPLDAPEIFVGVIAGAREIDGDVEPRQG